MLNEENVVSDPTGIVVNGKTAFFRITKDKVFVGNTLEELYDGTGSEMEPKFFRYAKGDIEQIIYALDHFDEITSSGAPVEEQ